MWYFDKRKEYNVQQKKKKHFCNSIVVEYKGF